MVYKDHRISIFVYVNQTLFYLKENTMKNEKIKEEHKEELDGNYMEVLSGLIMTEKDPVKADKLMKLYVDLERIVDKINDFLYQEYGLSLCDDSFES